MSMFIYTLRTGKRLVITQGIYNVSGTLEQYIETDRACAIVIQGSRGIGKTTLASYLEDHYIQLPTAIVTPDTAHQHLKLLIVDNAEKYPRRQIRNMLENLAVGQIAVLLVGDTFSPDIMRVVYEVPGLATRPLRLEPLTDEEASVHLENLGVQQEWHETLQHLFLGHPLALAYAAELVHSTQLPREDASSTRQALLQAVCQRLEDYLLNKTVVTDKEMYTELLRLIAPVRILTPALFQTLTETFTSPLLLLPLRGMMRTFVPPFLLPKADPAKTLRGLAARGLLEFTSDPSLCLHNYVPNSFVVQDVLRRIFFMRELHHPSIKLPGILQCLYEQTEAAAANDTQCSAAWKELAMDYQQDLHLATQALVASESSQS